MITLRLVVDLNVELYGVDVDKVVQNLRDLISHAEGDGLITGSTEAELVECLHDAFEIRPGDFGDFDSCRTIKDVLSTQGDAGSAAASDLSPSFGESVAISVVDGGSESIAAPIGRVAESIERPTAAKGRIRTRVRSDDFLHDCWFDAAPWFAQADEGEIEALHAIGWRGDQPADRVALELEATHPQVSHVLAYCRRHENCGFEVIIDEDDAKAWLLLHRPSLSEKLLQKEND